MKETRSSSLPGPGEECEEVGGRSVVTSPPTDKLQGLSEDYSALPATLVLISIHTDRHAHMHIQVHACAHTHTHTHTHTHMKLLRTDGLPWCLSGKESACNAGDTGDLGLIPESGRYPGERRVWQPTPVFLHGESHGQESLVGSNPQGHRAGHE